jgi:hypothetical protein
MRNDESRCDMAGVNESTPHCYLANVLKNDESRCDMAGVNESTPHCYLANVLISVQRLSNESGCGGSAVVTRPWHGQWDQLQ